MTARPLSAEALAVLSRVMPLTAADEAEPLAAALGEIARQVLGVPLADVVRADHAAERAERLRGTGTEVACLPLGESAWVLLMAGASDVIRDAGAVEPVVAAAAAALAQQEALVAQRREAALGRAARALQESLDASTLLSCICREAAHLVGADTAVILRAAGDALVVEAVHGTGPELVGLRLPADDGAAGRALAEQRPVRAGEQEAGAAGSPWAGARATVAVPIDWGGRLRGVLAAAYRDPAEPARERAVALAAFAEVAGTAFANASAHTGLALSARTDPLTGCLNHAALHDGLRREVERAERSDDAVLSLILLDLDRLRDANEDHGSVVAEEILRRAGHALRSTTRPYDLAARYGGTEFALVTVEADEQQACEIAARAVGRLTVALEDLEEGGVGSATAGVAQWSAGMTAGDLVARADRALMYAKRSGRRGEVLTEADLPPTFAPGRGRRRDRPLPPSPPATGWTPAAGDVTEPLRARARELARANRLGARLAALPTADAVVEAAVAGLREEFGYTECVVLPTGADAAPSASGIDVPIESDGEPWGTLRVARDEEPMGEADERLLEMVAAHLGAALAAARRREALEQVLLGAGESLAGSHGSRPVRVAVAVGRRLGMEDAALRDVALAALMREAPDATGALDGARALVLQARERWDGSGPGGLVGEAIPIGARVLAAAAAVSGDAVLDELRDGAGGRFDPAVVEAVRAELRVIER